MGERDLKLIPLTQGYVAQVDDEDYERLSKYRWYVKMDRGSLAYAVSDIGGGRQIRMHRLVLNSQEGDVIDHVDGNGLNNSRSNLMISSNAQNIQRSRNINGQSKYRGVSWDKIW